MMTANWKGSVAISPCVNVPVWLTSRLAVRRGANGDSQAALSSTRTAWAQRP